MNYLKLLTDNWAVTSPVALLLLSEFLSLHPNTKANGVIQLVIGLLTPKATPKP
jgi:hypothetical protein